MAYFHRAPCQRFLSAGCILLAGLVSLGSGLSGAVAADNEVREFKVKIDDKDAGYYHLSINRQDDGVTMVTGQADVKLKVAFIAAYTYKYQGAEAWKDGRLLRLESTCNDDGKQHAVSATAEPEATRVKADGHERTARPDVWTTSYWHLADAKFRNQSVPLLDADTGKDIVGTLQYIGTQQLNVSGQAENCAHYRVKADQINADLWYDGQERLVREESIEDGHRTALELLRIRK